MHRLHYLVVICKLLDCKCSFIGPNKWMSDGAKFGLYGGCFNTSDFRARSLSTVCATVWGRTLSWRKNNLFERSPRRFDRIAGFNSFTSMSLYQALVIVWLFAWKCTNIGTLISQKKVSMTFPGEACILTQHSTWYNLLAQHSYQPYGILRQIKYFEGHKFKTTV